MKKLINGINHITFSVNSIEDSFKFYKNVIGLTPVMKSSFSAYLTAGDMWIDLVQEEIQHLDDSYSHIAFNNELEIHYSTLSERIDFGKREWHDVKWYV